MLGASYRWDVITHAFIFPLDHYFTIFTVKDVDDRLPYIKIFH
ncbi:MAG: hypothetical protein MjAS7_0119 [Metallosphaera javensis (ex Sakai et al. 2022)]|nr:MAG: hypothetical protein MjAS7_0119 [Metallosphaera javensis (ex Sakai et al. 2022)]